MRHRIVAMTVASVVAFPIILGCTLGPTRLVCRPAPAAVVANINLGMSNPANAIQTAFISDASNLEGPPVVKTFEDPVWVAAKLQGSDTPALWLAEGSGHGFAYVANDAARAINYAGADLGGPPLGGDGEEVAINCALAPLPSAS